MAAKPQLSIQLRLRRPNAGGLYRGWPALTDPQAPESSTRKSSARRHRSTCADTRRSRRHRCAEFRTDRVRCVLSLNSPCQCLRTGLPRLPPRRSIGWPALERGHTWKGSFRAAEGRSTGIPGSLTSHAGLPKSGAIWKNRKILFQSMEGDQMDRMEAMSTFLTVVEQGSLSAAARRLKTPLTTVSRKVSELESHLRTKLFNRSSRQLVLTDTGTSYVAACKRILADVSEAERSASGEYAAPTGELAVTTPLGLGRVILMPIIADFLTPYPDIKVRMIPTDQKLSLAQEQIDVAVRIGELPDSSLVALRLGRTRRVVCGSPAYLAARGTPRMPEELGGHDCISYPGFSPPDAWTFVRDKATVAAPVHTRLIVGSAEAACAAARAGMGISIAFAYQIEAGPGEGALATMLDEFQPPSQPVT